MLRRMLLVLAVSVLINSPVVAQEILHVTLKKLDLTAMQAVIDVDDKSQEYTLTNETRVLDATGDTLAERLKGFTPGTAIFLRPEKRGDRILGKDFHLSDKTHFSTYCHGHLARDSQHISRARCPW